MAFNGERKETGVVQNVRGSAPYIKDLPSKVVRRNIRTSHVHRMKQEVIHIFSPDNVFLPDDLFCVGVRRPVSDRKPYALIYGFFPVSC